jgi:integrase
MAAVKVKGKYWAEWYCTEGHQHRKLPLVHTKKAARDLAGSEHEKVKAAKYHGIVCCPKLEKSAAPKTVAHILEDFLIATQPTKRSHASDVARARRLTLTFGTTPASSVTAKHVEDFKLNLAQEFSEATVNHYLKLMKAVFNRARRHGWVTHNPVSAVPLYTEHNARTRCLAREEEARLMEHLSASLRPLVLVALHTGMRKGELLNLRWTDVDLATGTVKLPLDKAGTGRSVALNSTAWTTLYDLQRHATSEWVFCSATGKKLHNFERKWRPALQAAQIPDFRFHDLRHTFASRLAMGGVDLYTLQRAGGWKSQAMVQRYAHLSPDHIRGAVERLVSGPPGNDQQTHAVIPPGLDTKCLTKPLTEVTGASA